MHATASPTPYPAMNIGMVSTRFAGTDGVSLEAAKLADVLTEAGHQVVWFAGELDPRFSPGMAFPAAHFAEPVNRGIDAACFGAADGGAGVDTAIRDRASQLERSLRGFLDEFDVALVVAENALCLPMPVPLGVALGEVLAAGGVPAIGHHHDFAWERDRFASPSVPEVIEKAFPPRLDGMRHVTIWSAGQRELLRRRGLPSTVLPNLMDFEQGPRHPGDPAAFQRAAGLGPTDVVLLQPTRVVPRKRIEVTVRLAHQLADERVKVVVTHKDGDEGLDYGRSLRDEAERLGVDLRFVPTVPDHQATHRRPRLADAYAAADLVCFPSVLEGFGNAILEAFFHRRPVLVSRYPAYAHDIAPTGVRCLEMNGALTPEIVKAAAGWIEDPASWAEAVAHNYQVGRERFSYAVARERFLPLVDELRARRPARV